MKKISLRVIYLLITCCFIFSNAVAQKPLYNAFAHNDYEHERPLLDALENGYNYVEADVWLIDNELYVYHNRPEKPDPSRTLSKLYLEPLKKRIETNEGRVFKGHNEPFYLMVDVKSEANSTYDLLFDEMIKFKEIIHTVMWKAFEDRRPVHVFVSGNRAVEEVLKGPMHMIGLDGRPDDLGKDIPRSLMPVVSDNYWKYSNWRGEGEMPEADKKKIRQLVIDVQHERKKVRLWGHPDHAKVWKQLIELEVDLINTDRLEAYREFLRDKFGYKEIFPRKGQ